MKTGIMKSVLAIIWGILLLCSTEKADAYPISVDIKARITDITDWQGYLTGVIAVGDIISGTYTYETGTPDTNPLPTVGDYRHTASPYGAALNINGYRFRTDPADVDFLLEICNDRPTTIWDAYLFHSYNSLFDLAVPPFPEFPGLLSTNTISFYLQDATGTALSSTEIPLVAPELSDWPGLHRLDLSSYSALFAGEFFYTIQADVFYVAPSSAVPEPTSLILLSTGIAGLVAYRGTSRRSRNLWRPGGNQQND